MATLNRKSFISSVFSNKALQNKMKKIAEQLIAEKVDRSTNAMLEEFENHPVTKEIAAGIHSSNTSGTLGGYGNLFTFIGFYLQDENPVYIARELLKDVKYKIFSQRQQREGVRYSFRVQLVNEKTIKDLSPLPWEPGLSWIHGIEKGISGFGFYMHKRFPDGRSTEGLQAKSPSGQLRRIRGGEYKPVKYFSEFYKVFEEEFNKK